LINFNNNDILQIKNIFINENLLYDFNTFLNFNVNLNISIMEISFSYNFIDCQNIINEYIFGIIKTKKLEIYKLNCSTNKINNY
jgi:hypothetical protein